MLPSNRLSKAEFCDQLDASENLRCRMRQERVRIGAIESTGERHNQCVPRPREIRLNFSKPITIANEIPPKARIAPM